MNKQELQNEINKTKEHLANMEKMLAECEHKRWKPTRHQEYWFVDDRSQIYECTFVPEDEDDSKRYETYNCFQTREQAEQEAENILVRRMLEDIARRLNKGENLDWSNNSQCKYYLYLWLGEELEQHIASVRLIQGVVYCLDENFKDVAIEEIGEQRLKKYLRGE